MVGSQEACSANESNASMDEALDAKVVSNDVNFDNVFVNVLLFDGF